MTKTRTTMMTIKAMKMTSQVVDRFAYTFQSLVKPAKETFRTLAELRLNLHTQGESIVNIQKYDASKTHSYNLASMSYY